MRGVAGLVLMQLAVPKLRTTAALRAFNKSLQVPLSLFPGPLVLTSKP